MADESIPKAGFIVMNTGGGDIYAGHDRESVLAAMREDDPEIEEGDVFEVDPNGHMQEVDDDEHPTGRTVSFFDEYEPSLGAYMIATEN